MATQVTVPTVKVIPRHDPARTDGWQPPRPMSREELMDCARRAFIGQPVLNINSLDPNDARGVADSTDHDRDEVRAAQLDIEVNSATFGDAS